MGRSRFSFSLGGWTASTRALELCRLGQALSPGLHTRGTPGAVVDPAQSQAHPCHADVERGDVRAHLTETAGGRLGGVDPHLYPDFRPGGGGGTRPALLGCAAAAPAIGLPGATAHTGTPRRPVCWTPESSRGILSPWIPETNADSTPDATSRSTSAYAWQRCGCTRPNTSGSGPSSQHVTPVSPSDRWPPRRA